MRGVLEKKTTIREQATARKSTKKGSGNKKLP
jgi:hypothetical protein